MSAEAYASLLEDSGHRVVQTASAWWYDAHPRWYQGLPLHSELTPSADELRDVVDRGAWVLRYTCPVADGSETYLSICDNSGYGLSSLGSTARRATRRGLENCTVRQLSFSELEQLGALELSRSTLVRQNRKVAADHDQYWRRHYAAAARSDITECWGAFVGDRLAAFLIAVTIDDCVYLPLLKSSAEDLSEYPNNALVYSFTADALARPNATKVSWGLESLLPGLGGLERFKEGMGYERRPIGHRIEMTRWLSATTRGPATWTVERLASHGRGGHTVARAAATLRAHADQPRLPRTTTPPR